VFTSEFRDLQTEIFSSILWPKEPKSENINSQLQQMLDVCGKDESMIALFEKAIKAHGDVLLRHKNGSECYLHLFFLTNDAGLILARILVDKDCCLPLALAC